MVDLTTTWTAGNIFTQLQMVDANQDHVIKKTGDQGYVVAADLNGDGKITETEAKYYLS